jgi:hypothetical protein
MTAGCRILEVKIGASKQAKSEEAYVLFLPNCPNSIIVHFKIAFTDNPIRHPNQTSTELLRAISSCTKCPTSS